MSDVVVKVIEAVIVHAQVSTIIGGGETILGVASDCDSRDIVDIHCIQEILDTLLIGDSSVEVRLN